MATTLSQPLYEIRPFSRGHKNNPDGSSGGGRLVRRQQERFPFGLVEGDTFARRTRESSALKSYEISHYCSVSVVHYDVCPQGCVIEMYESHVGEHMMTRSPEEAEAA